jgi:rubredoxin
MTDDLFREGGPHRIRRTGEHQYEMSVSLPPDEHGMIGRECSIRGCSPAYFKIKPGTGMTGEQTVAYCPYCRTAADPAGFQTTAQHDFARRTLENEAVEGVQRMFRDALGLGSSGRKKLGGGMFSIEMSLESSPRGYVSRPVEEELQRDIRCPSCGLEHAVFGLAFYCPDCGVDLFIEHVHQELAVTLKILDAIDTRREALGARVAARDVENALEDAVSLFETVLKIVTRRVLTARGLTTQEIDEVFRRHVRTTYQSVASAAQTFETQTGVALFAETGVDGRARLEQVFEKRHPITHNLGIVDRGYLRRAQSGELEGREVRVTALEVREAVEIGEATLRSAYLRTAGAPSVD